MIIEALTSRPLLPAYGFRGQAMGLTARKGRLFGNTSFWLLEMWKELLFRLDVALADISLFPSCSPSVFRLVALAVISFSLCRPPCWTEVQTSPHHSHSRHCLSFRPIHQVPVTPGRLFYYCLAFVYYLDTGNLEACALLLSRACLLTFIFLDR